MRFVGILRLINEDVIELAVELVAYPGGKFLVLQQRRRLADLVIEIDQPLARLRLLPAPGKSAAKGERGGEVGGEVEQRLQLADLEHRFEHARRRIAEEFLEFDE